MQDIRHPIEGVIYHPAERAASYLDGGAWMRSSVGDALRATARRLPGKAAFITDEGSLSFQELDAQSERLGAALLEIGLAPGDRAIFQMGTTLETVLALAACYKAGVVPSVRCPSTASWKSAS